MEPDAAADLVPDHRALDQLFSRLIAKLERGAAKESLSIADLIWARLAVHIRAEHLVMFPALRAAAPPHGGPSTEDLDAEVARLRADHDVFMVELATIVKTLKSYCETAPDRKLPEVAVSALRRQVSDVMRRLETHNELEESKTYRWLDLLLSPSERERVRRTMLRELQNMPPRFSQPES